MNVKRFIFIAIVAMMAVLPAFAMAQEEGGGLVPIECQRDSTSTEECSLNSLVSLVINVVNILIFTAGSIALLFVMYGGIQMILAGGNPEGIKAGKATLLNAIFGFVMVMTTFIVINFVVYAVTGGNINNFQTLRNFLSP